MNKIRISTNEMTMTVRMPDEQAEVWFGTLCRALLGDYPDVTKSAARTETSEADDDPYENTDAEGGNNLMCPVEGDPEGRKPQGYWGFLMIKCPVCGTVRGFAPKTPVVDYICEACGHRSPLEDMHKAIFRCKCGKSWLYRTNMTDRMIERPCLECGAPMTSEQDKHGDYHPVMNR